MSTPGVPGGALPFSGPLDLAKINAEWGLGTDLTQYHGVRWYYDGNLTTGLFRGSTIKVSDFYGKRATDPASGGVYFSNTAGSGNTIAPLYRNFITIEIWGGGGSGGGGNGGGGGGGAGNIPVPPPPVDVQVSGHGGQQLGQYGYTYNGQNYTAFTDSSGQLVGTVVQNAVTGAVVSTVGQTGVYGTEATRDNPF